MKKLLLAAACCVVGGSSMFGSSIFEPCATFPTEFSAGAGGPTNATCNGVSIPGGNNVTGVSIWVSDDYTFGLGAGQDTIQVVFTPSTAGGTTWANPTVTCTAANSGSGGGASSYSCNQFLGNINAPGTTQDVITSGNLAAEAASGFTVSMLASVLAGAVGTSSGGVIAEFDYTAQTGSAPEPGSMILLGSGLLAAGLIGRKKFAK